MPSADYGTDVHVMSPVVQMLLALRYSMLGQLSTAPQAPRSLKMAFIKEGES